MALLNRNQITEKQKLQLALAFASQLTAEASIIEEPGAGKLHAGICAGGTE